MTETGIKQERILGHNKRINILGIQIDKLNQKETIALVEKYVLNKEPLHLIGVNADKINSSRKNPRLKQIVNSCGIINADGASVVLASKFLKQNLPERVAGIDLMMALVELSEKKQYSVYLLGAKKCVVEKTAKELLKRYPRLNIVGVEDGYFKEEDWPRVSEKVKHANPDFVFVGITSPIKEYLVEFLQNDGNRSAFMGVGGSFDVISGEIPRAPQWMQKTNLEWLFRVLQEPKRLFGRYFKGNSKFIGSVIREKFSNKLEKVK
ncbi:MULTISPECIES: WecB/TagA/CpsF family glycosyltransferase [Lactobacillaceae]|uniref:WecB/TagA/CpsF family glycosyltransferase n=1 Tax=Lactobacillaceae TaxID=33958 RepID=UPI000F0B2678|nr:MULTISPECIES: WecB/TagA/CpsF family glycosyltransferase [Lactobacillaceae]MCJ8189539.1 WecB/TagA/CpsF family glycosyltransferase [Lactiplantibacillus pentosus]RND86653.1 putative N-acetylmannosaminyltransferase [Lacticaseibacillus paracasei]